MREPAIPVNEKMRLQSLYSYSILDTVAEKEFDDITRIASEICDTPISLITLIDSSRQWFKSNLGLKSAEGDRKTSFCGHAINEPEKF